MARKRRRGNRRENNRIGEDFDRLGHLGRRPAAQHAQRQQIDYAGREIHKEKGPKRVPDRARVLEGPYLVDDEADREFNSGTENARRCRTKLRDAQSSCAHKADPTRRTFGIDARGYRS